MQRQIRKARPLLFRCPNSSGGDRQIRQEEMELKVRKEINECDVIEPKGWVEDV